MGLASRGEAIRKLHSDLAVLGASVPVVEVAEATFGAGTLAAVRQVQVACGLEPSGIVDDATQAAIENAMLLLAYDLPRVEGRLLTERGLPAGVVPLTLVRRTPDGETERIWQGESLADGFYRIDYPAADGSRAEGASIEVWTTGQAGNEIPISLPKTAPARYELIDLVVPAAALPAPAEPVASEFQRLTKAVDQAAGGFGPLRRALEANHQGDDAGAAAPPETATATVPAAPDLFAAVHRATGWDARLLALGAVADRLGATTGMGAAAAYALVRYGLPTDADALAVVGVDAVTTALKRALREEIIELPGEGYQAAINAYETFATARRMAARAPGGLSSYQDFLDAAGLDGAAPHNPGLSLRDVFDGLVVAHADDPAALWHAVSAAGIGDRKIAELQVEGKLAALTGHNLQLVKLVKDDVLDGGTDPSAAGLRALARAGMYRADAWRSRLETLADTRPGDADYDDRLAQFVPPAFRVGVPSKQAVDDYTRNLAAQVVESFPTTVVGQKIAAAEIPLGAAAQSLAPHVADAFEAAEKLGFSLALTPAGPFLQAHHAELVEALPGLDEQTVVHTLAQLNRAQRLFQLTPSDHAHGVLSGHGIDSAHDLIRYGKREILEIFKKDFIPRELEIIWARTELVTAVTRTFFGATTVTRQPWTPGLSPPRHRRETAVTELARKFPTVEDLFGEQDFCACAHCRSVLSPAAYLVDLLHFLEAPRHGIVPLAALRRRRPDLEYLPLTCENTNTTLPAIDLALEVMEYRAAKGALTPQAVRDTGAAAAADLLAEPQYVETAAYGPLAAARYPLSLPFHLWLETVRGYLGRTEVDHAGLLDTLRCTDDLFAPLPSPKPAPSDPAPPAEPVPPATDPAPPAETPSAPPYYRAEVFFAQLGLAPAEVRFLTDPAEHTEWHRLYGYETAGEARSELRSAKTLSRRLGVSYVELADLLRTWFVNPNLDEVAWLRSVGVELLDVLRYHQAVGVRPFTADERADLEAALAAATRRWRDGGFPEFDAAARLAADWADGRFDNVLLLADDDPGCGFDRTELRMLGMPALPAQDWAGDTALDAVLLRLNLLVRLWRRLDWRLDGLDAALRALLPGGVGTLVATGAAAVPAKLGDALRTALPRLAHIRELARRFGTPDARRSDLVTLWSDLPTVGRNCAYARLFLTPRGGRPDPVFDDPAGDYLDGSAPRRLAAHRPAVEAALGMTAADVDAVLAAACGDPADAWLTLGTVSLLYRHALAAKALRLTIRDLITLRALSGVDPFGDPLSGTLAFCDLVDDLKAAGTTVAELDYLVRHSFDPLGPHRTDEAAVLRLAVDVADGLRRISAEHAVAADAGTLTDDIVARELGLVLGADDAATALAMWQHQLSWTAAVTGIGAQDQLPASTVAAFGELIVSWTADTPGGQAGTQTLTYAGVPVPGRIEAILQATGELADSTLGVLLAGVRSQADAARVPFDWLIDAADVPVLFSRPPDPAPGATPAEAAAALAAYESARRAHFAATVVPRIVAASRRRYIITAMGAALGAQAADLAPGLVEVLLTDADLLGDGPSGTRPPLLEMIDPVSAAGLSVAAADPDGAAVTVSEAGQDATTAGLAGAAQVVLDGYLQVPASGTWTLRMSVAGAHDTGELRLGDGPDPLLVAVGTGDAANPSHPATASATARLRAGVPYRFTLTATGARGQDGRPAALAGVVAVAAGDRSTALGPLSRFILRPANPLRDFLRAHTLLSKALLLVRRLGLTERELRHIAGCPDDFAGFDLGALPTTRVAAAAAQPIFAAVHVLVGYQRLRAELAGGGDGLVGVLELARRTLPESAVTAAAPAAPTSAARAAAAADLAVRDICARLAATTRRDADVVGAVVAHLNLGLGTVPMAGGGYRIGRPGAGGGGSAAAGAGAAALSLSDVTGLRRLWDALVLVERLGVGAAVAIGAAAPDPDEKIAHSLRDAVRARYDLDGWRAVAQSVNDPLRRRRRDAIVAYLLDTLRLDRVEQLYEELLLDPATEPVVRTTRIRQAIATVQLFVQRCLLNLETGAPDGTGAVPPRAIDTEQWDWMRRYRVWEANRKIFLWPENWAEPELRDDQTHLFTALTGALLQGDVTDRLAEDAFAEYLRGLAKIARLEILSMWAEPDPEHPGAGVIHVVGRDRNAPHTHYYRCRNARGWTPWQMIDAPIDGENVCVVVYRGRVHVFWVVFMEKGNPPAKLDEIQPPLMTVQAQLNWTELVAGIWTPRISSEFIGLDGVYEEDSFLASNVYVYAVPERGAGGDRAVRIGITGPALGVWKDELPPWLGLRFVSSQAPVIQVKLDRTLDLPWLPWESAYSNSERESLTGKPMQFYWMTRSGLAQEGELMVTSRYFGQDGKPTVASSEQRLRILREARPFTVLAAPHARSGQAVDMLVPFFHVDDEERPERSYGTSRKFESRHTFFVDPAIREHTFVSYSGTFGPVPAEPQVQVVDVSSVKVEPLFATKRFVLATGAVVPSVAQPTGPAGPVGSLAVFAAAPPADWIAQDDDTLLVGQWAVGPRGVGTGVLPPGGGPPTAGPGASGPGAGGRGRGRR